MKIFWERNKALNWKRKDYWDACDTLIKAYGLEAIRSKMTQLDKMTEYKPLISDPSSLRYKWDKIIIKQERKVITI